jgi:hypothetical protein
MDRAVAVFLLTAGACGAWVLNARRDRAAARLLGLGSAGALILALLGISWVPLGELGTGRLLVPALLFAVVPAAYACGVGRSLLVAWLGWPWRAALIAGALVLAVAATGREQLGAVAARCAHTAPLAIGLGPEREAVVAALEAHTSEEGRILWEDQPAQQGACRWSALLPVLTGRAYLGGLDTNPGIEHEYLRFADQMLLDRHLDDWTDSELKDFCHRYNIGWVVCWSPGAIKRFRAWEESREITPLGDTRLGQLFRIRRPLSFALRGQARWLHADSRRIALGEVTPENGVVVLSLHYQPGLRAAPGEVQVEREENPYGSVGFVRLLMPSPATRVVLTWDDR